MRIWCLMITIAMFVVPHTACADVRIFDRIAAYPVVSDEHLLLLDPLSVLIIEQSGSPWFLLMPADGRITSPFGRRRDPFLQFSRFHAGIDIANLRSSRVGAAARGTVARAGWSRGCGLMAVIDHGGGMETRYCHLESVCVRPGEEVGAGMKIGDMGDTGRSTGTHLHFELRIRGEAGDPAAVMGVW